jgi:hypothetical protein
LNQLFLSRTTGESNPEKICSELHGTIQKVEGPESTSDACRIVLRQAGSQGTGTITSTPTNLPTATQNRDFTTNPHETKSKLSNGSKAGIITAVVLCLSILAAVIVFMCLRRKRKTKHVETAANAPTDDNSFATSDTKDQAAVFLDKGSGFEAGNKAVEADGKAVVLAELPDTSKPAMVELSGDQEISELSAISEKGPKLGIYNKV